GVVPGGLGTVRHFRTVWRLTARPDSSGRRRASRLFRLEDNACPDAYSTFPPGRSFIGSSRSSEPLKGFHPSLPRRRSGDVNTSYFVVQDYHTDGARRVSRTKKESSTRYSSCCGPR